MNSKIAGTVLLVCLVGIVGGCTSTAENTSFGDVHTLVSRRSGYHVKRRDEEVIAKTVQSMLRNELTVDSSTQMALLNNPSLQPTVEELDIARADLLQAGLLRNTPMAVCRKTSRAEIVEATGLLE